MSKEETYAQLKRGIVDGDPEAVVSGTNDALEAGLGPLEIIEDGLLPGLTEIGEQFEAEEVFLPELMQAALSFQEAMKILSPRIQALGIAQEKKGVVVIGTVKGDMHSIGKNILALLFETKGFDVYDLGIDVDLFQFINKAEEVHADIIAMSALLTTTLVGQRDVIEALVQQGKREQYKVLVGGGATTQAWADSIGADGYAGSAYEAVTLATRLVS
ncbi:MAG: B12-binding domain-containing protein [Thermoleophilia bacterium]